MSGSNTEAAVLMVDPALQGAFPASVAFKPSCDRSQSWSLADFDVSKNMLGEGRFGRVYRVRHKASRKICVLKAMEKQAILSEDVLPQLKREVEVHTRLKHPHIIECYGHFQDKTRLYLVLEHADGGMLYQHLMGLKDKRMTERDAARVTQQVASALDYLHSINCMHRDLKPENILLAAIPNASASAAGSEELMDRYTVKLCDFGWSVPMKVDSRRVTLCGTVEYLPPEVASGDEYNFGFDLWTLGILVFEMLAGYSPFALTPEEVAEYGHDPEAAQAHIVKKIGELTFSIPSHFSRAAADLVKRLLKADGDSRLSPQQVLTHPWITRHCGPYTAASGAAADAALVLATGGSIAPWDNSAIPIPASNAAAAIIASSAPSLSRNPHALQASLAAYDAQQAALTSSKGIQAPSLGSLIQRKVLENEGEKAAEEEDGTPDVIAALIAAHADGVIPAAVMQEMRQLTTATAIGGGAPAAKRGATCLFDLGSASASSASASSMMSPPRLPTSYASAVACTPARGAATAGRGATTTASKAMRIIPPTPRGLAGGSMAVPLFSLAPAAGAGAGAAVPPSATPKSQNKRRRNRGGGGSSKKSRADDGENDVSAPASAAKAAAARVPAGATVLPIPQSLLLAAGYSAEE